MQDFCNCSVVTTKVPHHYLEISILNLNSIYFIIVMQILIFGYLFSLFLSLFAFYKVNGLSYPLLHLPEPISSGSYVT